MMFVRCVLCRTMDVDVEVLFCQRCVKGVSTDTVERMRREMQQFRMVVPNRLSTSNRFLKAMRASAKAIGIEPVMGPTVVRIIAQRSEYEGSPIDAYWMVRNGLGSLAFDEFTDVQSVNVTLLRGGNMLTMIEVRAMLDEELAGEGGVGR